jgi:hypothetical protein
MGERAEEGKYNSWSFLWWGTEIGEKTKNIGMSQSKEFLQNVKELQ